MTSTYTTIVEAARQPPTLSREIKETLTLGLPMAFALVAQTVMSFTDLVLIGPLGPDQVAGVSLSLAVYSTAMLFALGIVTAVSPRISQAFGAGDIETVRETVQQGCWIALAISLPAAVAVLFTYQILIAFGQDPGIAAIAGQYSFGAAFGLPAFIVYVNFRCFMSGVGQPKPTTWVMLSAVPVNAVVGYILIHGAFGIEGLGVTGAGMSSSIIRIGITIAVIFILSTKEPFRGLHVFSKFVRPVPGIIFPIIAVGLPIGLRVVLAEGLLPILALLVGPMGADQLVAHTVALRISSLTAVIALGFSGAASIRVGWNVGASNRLGVQLACVAAVVITVALTLPLSLALLAVGDRVAGSLFDIQDPETQQTVAKLLLVVAVYQIINAAQIVTVGSLLGLSDTKFPTYIVLFGTWGIGLGAAFVLTTAAQLEVEGVWLGLTLGVFSVLLIAGWRFIIQARAVPTASAPIFK